MNLLEWLVVISAFVLSVLFVVSEFVYRKTNNTKLSMFLESALNYSVGIFVVLMAILVVTNI